MPLPASARLGVCYYPEHWPASRWPEDATMMRELGLSLVRIGEFAWSRLEPEPASYQWAWLDQVMTTLDEAGLKVVLGTPTATPPKWLVDQTPDMLAVDEQGRRRRFGSRRHYCFSSRTYLRRAQTITRQLATRYAGHPALAGWQIDNEYGCHDTIRSYSPMALRGFRRWLERRYGSIDALNAAWGTVFWSQEYRDFGAVELPFLTVTEPHPAHVLDFYRFSSDQAVSFHQALAEEVRRVSDAPVIHNFMGFEDSFDHHELAADLDVVSWDSYPLGFLDVGPYPAEDKQRYLRQGHPDFAAFHHDLYRGCGKPWWVMEQQPGPVNWAHHNPAPRPGMVTAWTEEAVAHGAEVVSYFRWRQVPFAQEQNHAGLLRPDGSPAPALAEVQACARHLAQLPAARSAAAPVALVFSYLASWMFQIQPQGGSWNYWRLVLDWYSALRTLGLSVDVVSEQQDLSDYPLVLAPSLPVIPDALAQQLRLRTAPVLLGPRSGSRDQNFQIPDSLGLLPTLIPVAVTQSESLPADYTIRGQLNELPVTGRWWLDHVETHLAPSAVSDEGPGLWYRNGPVSYLTCVPDAGLLSEVLSALCAQAGLATHRLPEGLRIRDHGALRFAVNYAAADRAVPAALRGDEAPLIGDWTLPPAGTAWWQRPASGNG